MVVGTLIRGGIRGIDELTAIRRGWGVQCVEI